MAWQRDPGGRAHSGRHLDLRRRPRARRRSPVAAADRPARRDGRHPRWSCLPVRGRRRRAPARWDRPRHTGHSGDGRPPAEPELRSDRCCPGWCRVRRRRLHGHDLAEHDRPLASRPAGTRRRPSSGGAALCRRRCRRRPDRDRRWFDTGRNGQRRGSVVRPGNRPGDADRAACRTRPRMLPQRPSAHACT